MRVAAAPLDLLTGDVPSNLAQARSAVDEAAAAGAELLALPEMWPTSFVPNAGPDELASSQRAVEDLAHHAAAAGIAARPASPSIRSAAAHGRRNAGSWPRSARASRNNRKTRSTNKGPSPV